MPLSGILSRRTPTLMAGRLRHRISITIPNAGAQDTTGGFSKSAGQVVYANVWASIDAITGQEKFAAHEFVSQVSHQVTIRYIGAAPSWQPNTNYLDRALVKDRNGNLQQAQGPGQSGVNEPTWNAILYGITADNGVSWKNLGTAPAATGVTAGMQVVFQSRVFQIEAVLNPDERNKVLVLMCIEINDARQQTVVGGNYTGGGGGQQVTIDGGGF